MRKFSSYGPIDAKLHYYAPRTALIQQAYAQLLGENPADGGHYITVWGPRQTGKTWVMQQVLYGLQTDPQYAAFAVAKINVQHLYQEKDVVVIAQAIAQELTRMLGLPAFVIQRSEDFQQLFAKTVLPKPLILLLDEFDALGEAAIQTLAAIFRNIYINRRDQFAKPSSEKDYLLHSVALIGVRAVLGIENVTGSPFNVQRSLPIPNLTEAEVAGLFHWYTQESGQTVEQAVIDRIFMETQGQPGLTCWLGELLTETYNHSPTQPLTLANFEEAYAAAVKLLPNNNLLNLISKADQPPYKQIVLNLFKTNLPMPFRYDDRALNYLYTNGVIAPQKVDPTEYYVKFSSPFVQKRLFNYFARELFPNLGVLYDPFADVTDTITDTTLNVHNLIRRYEAYLQANRAWLLKDAPRRNTDEHIFEAVYHFNLYMYLAQFLQSYGGSVVPEFPTGNGKLDLLLHHANRIYGIEVKSFVNRREYQKALQQAAHYGQQLQLQEMTLVFFVETVDEGRRRQFEAPYLDAETNVTVYPLLVATGS